MKPRTRFLNLPTQTPSFFALSLVSMACSSDPNPNDGTGGAPGSGGVATGGNGSGGTSTGGSGGVASGGQSSGGTGAGPASGGAMTGGQGSGGAATGGDGGAGGTGGVGGTGGTVMMPVTPTMNSDSSYELAFDDTVFEVDPTQGARIVTLSHDGTNLLAPLEQLDFLNGGSTFWLSPQTGWDADPDEDWPPPPGIDSDPYTASIMNDQIVTESSAVMHGDNSQVISKAFSADSAQGNIHITYGVTNNGPGQAAHGPWEVSRHARGAMIVWPGADTPDETWEFEPDYVDGVYFLQDDQALTGKVFTDGTEGWIAYVQGSLALIKVWENIDSSEFAPAHGEVEVYLDPADSYVEVEMHGAFQGALASGASFTWDVDWYVRPVPNDLDVSVGSADLVSWIESIIPPAP